MLMAPKRSPQRKVTELRLALKERVARRREPYARLCTDQYFSTSYALCTLCLPYDRFQ